MRRMTKCISCALLLLLILTTCVYAQYPREGETRVSLYIEINIPDGDERLDAILREWVEFVYIPTLARGGVFANMEQGDLTLDFDWAFQGAYYAGVSLRGTFVFTREGQAETTMQLAESLNIHTESGAFLSPAALLDIHEVDTVLDLLRDAIISEVPGAAPYTYAMDLSWLASILLGEAGLIVPLDGRRFMPDYIGEMVITIPYEALGTAFLLAGEGDFPAVVVPSIPVMPSQGVPPMWPHAAEDYTPVFAEAHDPTHVTIDYSYIYSTPRRPRIALTFDDGPSRYTEIILDALDRYGGRVTFCVMGYRIEEWAPLIERAHNAGHEIMGHSWRHTNMMLQNRADIVHSIRHTDDLIYEITGTRTNLFRPPYGAINSQVETVAASLGYGILLWSIDPQDWRLGNRNVQHIYSWIVNRATDGAIVVLHDVIHTTALAMERVIPRLIEDGFELVTASEILADHYGEIIPGMVYRGLR
ncbi:MAG: polysaccharide deacetylase family protein [Defluviitaleaceae bacterium]|nr:polysaccharide deacetylase family protein [Defluviitaleaceae bacterium]MCL2274551.1 polysaccharide deacetylase family protein [Defluviitaleaceae bacterium]